MLAQAQIVDASEVVDYLRVSEQSESRVWRGTQSCAILPFHLFGTLMVLLTLHCCRWTLSMVDAHVEYCNLVAW